MAGQNVQRRTEKTSYFLVLVIVFVIFGVSASFFWSGNIFYGVVIISLPIVSVIVSTACYLAHKKQQETNGRAGGGNDVQIGISENDEERLGRTFSDRPPSYRMTWRRSFMKKMKYFRSGQTHQEEIEENQEEVELNTIDVGDKDITENPDPRDNSDTATSPGLLTVNEGLPSYDEALEIIASREQINQS